MVYFSDVGLDFFQVLSKVQDAESLLVFEIAVPNEADPHCQIIMRLLNSVNYVAESIFRALDPGTH